MRQPSVLQIVSSTARRGAETFAVELEPELEARGHAVETWALQSGGGEQLLPVPILGPSPFSPTTLRALRRRGRAGDVVIAHGSVTLPAAVAALAGTRTPIVYRNIGDPLYWSSTPSKRLRTRVLLSRHAPRRRAGAAIGNDAARELRRALGSHHRDPERSRCDAILPG